MQVMNGVGGGRIICRGSAPGRSSETAAAAVAGPTCLLIRKDHIFFSVYMYFTVNLCQLGVDMFYTLQEPDTWHIR